MTLRTRLAVAFLTVMLGPVLLAAAVVAYIAGTVADDRAAGQLDAAATVVHGTVTAQCGQLRATADLLAAQPAKQRTETATELVELDLVSVVQLPVEGRLVQVTDGRPPRRWADCAGRDLNGPPVRYGALAAGAPLPTGGIVWVATRVDEPLIHHLADVAGVDVTLLGAGPTDPLYSTDPEWESTVAAAAQLPPGERTRSTQERHVLRVPSAPGQPLPLLLSTPHRDATDQMAWLGGAVAVTGLLAGVVAWLLATSATRPLRRLAQTADRVAAGELDLRVPTLPADETGQLAAAVNRMARRTQGYAQALAASREQLRRHLAVLGDTLSSTHDLDRILQVILWTAQVATGARAGAVLLIEEGSRNLVGHTTAELEAAAIRGGSTPVRVPLGEGLLGGAAAAGTARRGRVAQTGIALHKQEPRCDTYLVVPISAPTNGVVPPAPWPAPLAVRGVLAVYDRLGGDDFDDADLAMLRTFAGQAGVAVDNVRVHQETQRLSLTDPLTGLWNYRHLRTILRQEVERSSRFHHHLALLMLDLDRFKSVNDAYGHPAGDAVLAEFATRVRSLIREVDVAFRHGGEEFVVLLPETDAHGATVLAQRLGAAIRDTPVEIAARGETTERLAITVTVSIGIAVYPSHGRHPETLLEAADHALYAAKAAGRDTYRVAGGPVEADAPKSRHPGRQGVPTSSPRGHASGLSAQELSVLPGASTPTDAQPRAGGRRSLKPPPPGPTEEPES